MPQLLGEAVWEWWREEGWWRQVDFPSLPPSQTSSWWDWLKVITTSAGMRVTKGKSMVFHYFCCRAHLNNAFVLLQGVVYPTTTMPPVPWQLKKRETSVVSTQIYTQITHVCRHMQSLNAFLQRNPVVERKFFSSYWFLESNSPLSATNPHMLKARSHYCLFLWQTIHNAISFMMCQLTHDLTLHFKLSTVILTTMTCCTVVIFRCFLKIYGLRYSKRFQNQVLIRFVF